MTHLINAETLEQGFEVPCQNRRAGDDFADAEGGRAALGLFEAERVSKVDSEAPGSVRLSPI